MKHTSLKPQLKLAALTPAIVVASLFALFCHGQIDTSFMQVKQYQMYIVSTSITLLGLVCGFLLYYFLFRKVYHPIARLYRSMKRILQGEFETPIKIVSKGELGVIEQGCAYLQQQYIEATNDLHQQVETATADLQHSLELLEEKNIELSLSKKKLAERNRNATSFIANMTHEVRTPMNGIIGFTNVLLETSLTPLQADYVKTIETSARDLLCIINDILDYSKLDAGKLRLDAIPVDFRACVDEVLSLVAPSARKKNIDLIPITEDQVPKVLLGDPLRIKQILTNLISNAVKFTDYGHVCIRTGITEEKSDYYRLSITISDTGIGIPTDVQATLFSAFHQAGPSTARHYGGSGLGLVICKKLVEHMNGQIHLESIVNKGTTFSVELKLHKLAAYEAEKHQQKLRFSQLTAICYDENPLHMEALNLGLKYWGVTTIKVNTLPALQKALLEHPHADISFIHVSQGNESKTLYIAERCNIPCVFVSKHGLHTNRAFASKKLLRTPLNIQKIEDAIETALNHSHQSSQPSHHAIENLRGQLRQKNPHLLIAEDNPVNLMLFKSLLAENARVTTVEDGQAAVDIAHQQPFTVILLDLQMPRLSGLEAARAIRIQCPLNRETPVILISANPVAMTQDMTDNTSIICCLQKPIDESHLLQQLLKVIPSHHEQAIDWSLCIKKLSGNQSLAKEFLARFVEELVKNRAEFIQLMQNNQVESLGKAAHKLHGACCFCGVSALQKNVSELETQAQQVKHTDELKLTFEQLIQSIDDVICEYHREYKDCDTYLNPNDNETFKNK